MITRIVYKEIVIFKEMKKNQRLDEMILNSDSTDSTFSRIHLQHNILPTHEYDLSERVLIAFSILLGHYGNDDGTDNGDHCHAR